MKHEMVTCGLTKYKFIDEAQTDELQIDELWIDELEID